MESAGKLQSSGCVCSCLTVERELQVKAWVIHSAGTEQLKWVLLGYQQGLRQPWSLISSWLMLLSTEPAAHPLAHSSGQERGNWMFSVPMTEANVYWQGPQRPACPAPCSEQVISSFHSLWNYCLSRRFTEGLHVVATSHCGFGAKETGVTNWSLLKWHKDLQETLFLCLLKQIGLVSHTLRRVEGAWGSSRLH